MVGRITSIGRNDRGALQGRVKDTSSQREYTIYFNRGIAGIEVGQLVNFTVKVSKVGNEYASYDSVCEAAGEATPTAQNTTSANAPAPEATTTEVSTPEVSTPESEYKSVSEINAIIKSAYDHNPSFKNVMVMGEVTNFSGTAKHGNTSKACYFDIKDENEIISCVMWALDSASEEGFELKSGVKVGITGKLDYYKGGGKSQLVVSRIVDLGEGPAKLALLRLYQKLEAEGLFSRKRPKPDHPKKIGIITSADGKARGDIEKVAKECNPYILMELYNVNVQGKNAEPSIVRGIQVMDERGYDAIIVCRGGGSDEDLSCFNSELIARAMYAARTFMVAAVGHQDNYTIVDYVADLRAATPSDAAKLVVPDVMKDIKRVKTSTDMLKKNINNKLTVYKYKLNEKRAVLEKNSPISKLKERQSRLELQTQNLKHNMNNLVVTRKNGLNLKTQNLKYYMNNLFVGSKNRLNLQTQNLSHNMSNLFISTKNRFEKQVVALNSLSPTAKLINGFGYIAKNENPVTTAADIKPSDELKITVHDGEISAVVSEVVKKTFAEDK